MNLAWTQAIISERSCQKTTIPRDKLTERGVYPPIEDTMTIEPALPTADIPVALQQVIHMTSIMTSTSS